jgi:hypothetical protein
MTAGPCYLASKGPGEQKLKWDTLYNEIACFSELVLFPRHQGVLGVLPEVGT